MFREFSTGFWFVLCLCTAAVIGVDGRCSKSTDGAEDFTDPASQTVVASVVFEGILVGTVLISDPEDDDDAEEKISAARFTVERIHKGHLPIAERLSTEGVREVFLRVEPGCVPRLKRSRRYVVFLSPSWSQVGQRVVHWASAAPQKYSKKTAREVEGHSACGLRRLSADPCRVVVRLSPARNLSVTNGSDVIVNCTITGKPRPQITWFRNDKPFEKAEILVRNKGAKTQSQLRVKGAKYEDGGDYWCQAKNVFGITNSSVLALTVTDSHEEVHYLPCPDPRYCLKGECHTLPGVVRPRCTCPQGYTGHRCQDRELDYSTIDVHVANLERILAFGTFLFLILIFFVFVGVFCCITRFRHEVKERVLCKRLISDNCQEIQSVNTEENQRLRTSTDASKYESKWLPVRKTAFSHLSLHNGAAAEEEEDELVHRMRRSNPI